MPNDKKLSNLQLRILDILWENAGLSVQEITERLEPHKKLAPNSVATMLSRLEKRGFVKYSKIGRKYIYSAGISKAEVTNSKISSLINNLFKGNKAALVSHLLAEDLSLDELEQIQNIIRERENPNA